MANNMFDASKINTLMVVTTSNHLSGNNPTDAQAYRSLIGSLQYLILTHPDLSHVVNHAYQQLQNPTEKNSKL